jgi:hypothetical protein
MTEKRNVDVLLELNESWRVVDDPVQWLLQRAGKKHVWKTRSYCATRTGLELCIREYCGEISEEARAALADWPRVHG